MYIQETAAGNQFDAIVIGSGISGGWAAKELTKHGLKTLVLERGRDVKHVTDYPTGVMNPWEFEHRNQLPLEVKQANPVVSKCYAFYEGTTHFFVKDAEHPYVQEKPFDWIRGYQVGGKSLLWARQTQRWSDLDFEGPARDGFAVDWPIRYADLAPWYSYVEKFAGISGNKDGLAQLPDGEFQKPHEMNCAETHFQKAIASKYKDRQVIQGRCAHLTEPKDIHFQQGRAQCQHRTICERGCPFGGYFSSNASTIPWAMKTGKMTLRPDSVVHSIIYDEKKGKATGVRVVDANTKKMTEYYARIIFVNAAAMNTNLILLNSTSNRFPTGLGNDSGVLGKYVAFHNYRATISAQYDGDLDSTTAGRRPNSPYIPRFRNLHKQETNFLRGYAAGFNAGRSTYTNNEGIGADLKKSLLNPSWGGWHVGSHMMGETIPKENSTVSLDGTLKDPFGIPQLKINMFYDDNDEKMMKDFYEQFTEMYEAAGFKNIKTRDSKQAPGLDIHEMGGARMGKDPKTSMLNKWNQLHACKNVFVTDGAAMTSTSTQNPSLTYMALTARAVDYAVKEMKKQNL
ncbi:MULTISPECIES: FAD-dependent oxidoreductase [unclassified Siphonobacter]|uniref:FAD-dependent oxidoreductase n=1 Tax=unclassified Siphonobacter TaxID=2635712 RepID=UPI000CB208A0|nr:MULTISPECIES: GMC family oxidoreductase [unclassified Siphonobacter]MDQ1089559.1 choline dehydrogenase-like flavoprotein [Siphonobacter sp. SORGH_AS_1065]MDR6195800.1 choline dehydrogenase-like flavoprotein [Siphonobacter sp. SORGH_AS_0500]PKK37471.1 GMC family oxidoreductase [Siphonobacter sp. SORGH_AS_0500]